MALLSFASDVDVCVSAAKQVGLMEFAEVAKSDGVFSDIQASWIGQSFRAVTSNPIQTAVAVELASLAKKWLILHREIGSELSSLESSIDLYRHKTNDATRDVYSVQAQVGLLRRRVETDGIFGVVGAWRERQTAREKLEVIPLNALEEMRLELLERIKWAQGREKELVELITQLQSDTGKEFWNFLAALSVYGVTIPIPVLSPLGNIAAAVAVNRGGAIIGNRFEGVYEKTRGDNLVWFKAELETLVAGIEVIFDEVDELERLVGEWGGAWFARLATVEGFGTVTGVTVVLFSPLMGMKALFRAVTLFCVSSLVVILIRDAVVEYSHLKSLFFMNLKSANILLERDCGHTFLTPRCQELWQTANQPFRWTKVVTTILHAAGTEAVKGLNTLVRALEFGTIFTVSMVWSILRAQGPWRLTLFWVVGATYMWLGNLSILSNIRLFLPF